MLLRPLWLAALIPLALLAVLILRRARAGGWEAIIHPEVLARMRALGIVAGGAGLLPRALPFAAAAVIVAALSGPARLTDGGPGLVAADPLILMLDMSPSVAGGARLDDAQAAAAQILQLAARPVGVMVYAGDAYSASAPTSDAASLQGLVAVLGPQTMPLAGSRPDIALAHLRDLFGSMDGADLIVISDGGGTGTRATEEAERLRSEGARLWTLALDQPDALAALARAGGGEMLPAREARELMRRIEAGRRLRLAQGPDAPLIFRDLGPWLLPLAMALLLPLFRRRA